MIFLTHHTIERNHQITFVMQNIDKVILKNTLFLKRGCKTLVDWLKNDYSQPVNYLTINHLRIKLA